MKHFNLFLIFTLFSTGLSFAANAPIKQSNFVATHPLLHRINLRLMNQRRAVHTAIQQNKISATQKATFYANLRSAHQLEVGFIKQDNRQDLNSDQANQITALLDQNKQTLTTAGISENTSPKH